jgi:hypothetical protein
MRSLSDLFRNFLQLGYVTDDIDVAAAYLESAMGTGKCQELHVVAGGRTPPASAGDPRAAFVVDGAPADEWLIDVAGLGLVAGNSERPGSRATAALLTAVATSPKPAGISRNLPS